MDLSKMSYGELLALSDTVSEQIVVAEGRGKAAAIEQIHAVAASVGLSLREILGGKEAKTAKPRAHTQRYIDPVNPSNVWGGAGPRPAWMKSALAAGVPIEQLRAQV